MVATLKCMKVEIKTIQRQQCFKSQRGLECKEVQDGLSLLADDLQMMC